MTHKLLVTLGAAVLLLLGALYFSPGVLGPVESQASDRTVALSGPMDSLVPRVDSAQSLDLSGERSSLLAGEPNADASSAAVPTECVVVGRLIGAQGLPVSGGRIVARLHMGWEREATSDAEGRFELVCPREARTVTAIVPPFDFHAKAWLSFGSSDNCRFPSLTESRVDVGDVRLDAASVVIGRVVDEAGAPVSGAKALANPMEYGVATNDRGEFRLLGIKQGANRLRIYMDTHTDVFEPIESEAGHEADVGTITAERLPQFRVRGCVVNEAGIPVPGARVYSPSEEVIAGVDGRFEHAFYGRDHASLNAAAVGYRESCNTACDDGSEVLLVVRELGPLCRFLVVDAESQLPLSGASIRVSENGYAGGGTDACFSTRFGASPSSSPLRFTVGQDHESSPGGRLDVHVIPGVDVVTATVQGYADQEIAPAMETLQGGTQRIEMRRPPSALITGTVPAGLGVELPCVVEFHGLERLASHLPMEGVRATEWEAPPASAVGAEHGAELKEWLGEAPVLRMTKRFRVHADAQGNFRLKTDGKTLVRAVCRLGRSEDGGPGRVALSSLVCPSVGESMDVGEMIATELGVLAGRVALPFAAMAEDLELSLEGRDQRRARATDEGAFKFAGLIPGRYRMVPSGLPTGVPRAPFERIVDVQPGGGQTLVIDPELGEFGEVEFSLSLNGAPPTGLYYVGLHRDEKDDYGGSDGSPNGVVHMMMPVGAGYRVSLEVPGIENAEFEVLDRFEVLPGKSAVHLEVQTCRVVCEVPAKHLDPTVSRWQLLLWKDSAGNEREPIQAGDHISGIQNPDESTGRIDVAFPYVPLGAQDLRLEIQPDDEDDPRRQTIPFEAKLVQGEVVRVELEP